MKTWQEIRAKKFTPDQLGKIDAAVEQEVLDLDLKNLREALGLTQTELAARVGITQSELSKLERRENHRINTLRKYVKALGGTLEIHAVIDGHRVRVNE
jgi:predicted transcriptional regulator